jgi:hypothetical protein
LSGSNFNPQNTLCIPVVKIFAFLELEQKFIFFKGLSYPRREFACFLIFQDICVYLYSSVVSHIPFSLSYL